MAVSTFRQGKQLTGETDRRLSYSIWKDCPISEFVEDRSIGTMFELDVNAANHITTPTITTVAALGFGGLKAFGSAGGTLVVGTSDIGGSLVLTESDADQGVSIQQIATPFKIYRGAGDLWFECRLKLNSITDSDFGILVGLGESMTLSATVPITAADAIADQNVVGFFRATADGDQLDTVYKANGVTAVTVKADAMPSALVADTYFKIGMRYNDRTHRLHFYANGILLPDYKTIPATNDGTDFPDDVLLSPFAAFLGTSNNDAIMTISHLRCFQLMNS